MRIRRVAAHQPSANWRKVRALTLAHRGSSTRPTPSVANTRASLDAEPYRCVDGDHDPDSAEDLYQALHICGIADASLAVDPLAPSAHRCRLLRLDAAVERVHLAQRAAAIVEERTKYAAEEPALIAAVREQIAGLVAELDTPLPEGDAGIIEHDERPAAR